IAATSDARRPRRSSSCTMASTACASPRTTSRASGPSLTAPFLPVRVVAEDGMELVLEAAGLDGAMDAALLRRVLFPPPAAGAVRLPRLDRPRAGCAADRGVAAVVERVVWDVVLADVVPDLLLGPLRQR